MNIVGGYWVDHDEVTDARAYYAPLSEDELTLLRHDVERGDLSLRPHIGKWYGSTHEIVIDSLATVIAHVELRTEC